MAEARKIVTVVFADVSESTELGERLDPEVLRRVMDRYFATARDVLVRHGGTVEKFIGDAVVAVFGTPVAHEDDALRAVRATAEMREAFAALNEELLRDQDVTLAVRTGVNTGEVVAGHPAEGQFYVTGDAVNVAARLEQAAQPGEILLGERTYQLVQHAVAVEALEPLALKGKSQPFRAYRLVDVIEGVPAFARRFDTPFVGREPELRRLMTAFQRSMAGRVPALVTILGSAGVGKTRLAAEFSTLVERQAFVLEGRCLSYGEGITFWPLEEIRRKLQELPRGIPEPEGARSVEEAFFAYRRLFEELGRRGPLVVVLEDIHWAEPTLLDFVEHLAAWTRDAQILILCLARPEFVDERSGWSGDVLELDPLPEQDAKILVRALADNVDAETCARATEIAEGNPLFLEQLLALETEDGGEAAIPHTIHALLAARLDRLEPTERLVVEAAAVIGKEFWRGALLHLTPPGTEVSPLLQRLVRRRLIRPVGSSFHGEDAFHFAHILVRDAAYAGISKESRADWHERFADWLEASESPYDEIIGYHLECASRYAHALAPTSERSRELARRAGRKLAAAGKRAHARQDHAAAANLLARAVDVLPEDDNLRLALVAELADDLFSLGRYDDARSLLRDAGEGARRAADRRLEWHVRIGELRLEAQTETELLSVHDLVEKAGEALAAFEELDDPVGRAKARMLIGFARNGQFRNEEARETLERALEESRLIGDTALEGSCLSALARALLDGPTPAAEAIDRIEELLRTAPTPVVEMKLLSKLAILYAERACFGKAREILRRSRALTDEFGTEVDLAHHLAMGAAIVERWSGNLAGAEAKLLEGHRILERLGEKGWRSTVAATLARVVAAQGRFSEAEGFLREAEETGAYDDLPTQFPLRLVRAKIAAGRGDLEEAEALARDALALLQGTDDLDSWGLAFLNLAQVLCRAGRVEQAVPAVAEAVRLFEQKGNVVWGEEAQSLLRELTTDGVVSDETTQRVR